MGTKEAIKLFEEKRVRTAWDDEQEKWYFSIVDVVQVLTDSDYQTARKYWKVLKGRIVQEAGQPVTICYQLKMLALGQSENFVLWPIYGSLCLFFQYCAHRCEFITNFASVLILIGKNEREQSHHIHSQRWQDED